jgi:hypothetical protein
MNNKCEYNRTQLCGIMSFCSDDCDPWGHNVIDVKSKDKLKEACRIAKGNLNGSEVESIIKGLNEWEDK